MDEIEKRMHELRTIAKEYAIALSQKDFLEEFKKSKIALLCKDAELQGHATYAAQEREARANPKYIELLEGLRDATERAERLRWELELAKIGAEVWRSKEATRRAERAGYRA